MAADSAPAPKGEARAATRRLRCLCVLVLMGALAVACVSGDEEASPATTGTSIDGPVTTSGPGPDPGPDPDPGPGPDPGPPLDVPPIGGDDVDSVLEDAKRQFRRVCGGTVCVTLEVVVPDPPPGQECDDEEFVGTAPPEGSQVRRGSTVRLLFELDDCFATETTDPTTTTSTTTTND